MIINYKGCFTTATVYWVSVSAGPLYVYDIINKLPRRALRKNNVKTPGKYGCKFYYAPSTGYLHLQSFQSHSKTIFIQQFHASLNFHRKHNLSLEFFCLSNVLKEQVRFYFYKCKYLNQLWQMFNTRLLFFSLAFLVSSVISTGTHSNLTNLLLSI